MLLSCCLSARSTDPWLQKPGVRPRPRFLHGVHLLRFFQKPVCDGFLVASVVLLSVSSSVHGFSVDGGGQRWWWLGGTEDPVDLVVIYFLLESFVQKVGTAVPLCNVPVRSCTCPGADVRFLYRIIQILLSKKKTAVRMQTNRKYPAVCKSFLCQL